MKEVTPDKTKIQVGETIKEWEGLEEITPYLHVSPPAVDDTNPDSRPNLSKYPNVVGSNRLSVTEKDKGASLPARIRKRSWMGWFLWGDGTPPPGISAGYPAQETDPPKYNNDNWDFYSWQYSAGDPIESGSITTGHPESSAIRRRRSRHLRITSDIGQAKRLSAAQTSLSRIPTWRSTLTG
jgi:hypothetical protein